MRKVKRNLGVMVLALMMLGFSIAPAQAQTFDIYMAYQTYDNGFMLWNGDTGQIYAFYNNMRYDVVSQSSYGFLPDNPVQEPTPANRIRPISGFGKVWGNFPDIRDALGWATSNEQGYTSNFAAIGRLTVTYTLPDGARILLNSDGTWEFTDYVPQPTLPPPTVTYYPPPGATPTYTPAPNTVSIPSTFQYFERGFMMWWSDGGTVWVFLNNGTHYNYSPGVYGVLPDNPFYYPPPGYVRPIMGFGKVWGNYTNLRASLGWATTFELGYTATVQRIYSTSTAANIIVNDPNGRSIFIRDNGSWYYQ